MSIHRLEQDRVATPSGVSAPLNDGATSEADVALRQSILVRHVPTGELDDDTTSEAMLAAPRSRAALRTPSDVLPPAWLGPHREFFPPCRTASGVEEGDEKEHDLISKAVSQLDEDCSVEKYEKLFAAADGGRQEPLDEEAVIPEAFLELRRIAEDRSEWTNEKGKGDFTRQYESVSRQGSRSGPPLLLVQQARSKGAHAVRLRRGFYWIKEMEKYSASIADLADDVFNTMDYNCTGMLEVIEVMRAMEEENSKVQLFLKHWDLTPESILSMCPESSSATLKLSRDDWHAAVQKAFFAAHQEKTKKQKTTMLKARIVNQFKALGPQHIACSHSLMELSELMIANRRCVAAAESVEAVITLHAHCRGKYNMHYAAAASLKGQCLQRQATQIGATDGNGMPFRAEFIIDNLLLEEMTPRQKNLVTHAIKHEVAQAIGIIDSGVSVFIHKLEHMKECELVAQTIVMPNAIALDGTRVGDLEDYMGETMLGHIAGGIRDAVLEIEGIANCKDVLYNQLLFYARPLQIWEAQRDCMLQAIKSYRDALTTLEFISDASSEEVIFVCVQLGFCHLELRTKKEPEDYFIRCLPVLAKREEDGRLSAFCNEDQYVVLLECVALHRAESKDFAGAQACVETSLRIQNQCGIRGIARGHLIWGTIHALAGNLEDAAEEFRVALETSTGHFENHACALLNWGLTAWIASDRPKALKLIDDCLAMLRENLVSLKAPAHALCLHAQGVVAFRSHMSLEMARSYLVTKPWTQAELEVPKHAPIQAHRIKAGTSLAKLQLEDEGYISWLFGAPVRCLFRH